MQYPFKLLLASVFVFSIKIIHIEASWSDKVVPFDEVFSPSSSSFRLNFSPRLNTKAKYEKKRFMESFEKGCVDESLAILKKSEYSKEWINFLDRKNGKTSLQILMEKIPNSSPDYDPYLDLAMEMINRGIDIQEGFMNDSILQKGFDINSLKLVTCLLKSIQNPIQRKAYINQIDQNGKTIFGKEFVKCPSLVYYFRKHKSILKLLLDEGAEPTEADLRSSLLGLLKPEFFEWLVEFLALKKRLAPMAFMREVVGICVSEKDLLESCLFYHLLSLKKNLGFSNQKYRLIFQRLTQLFKVMRYLKGHGAPFNPELLKLSLQDLWEGSDSMVSTFSRYKDPIKVYVEYYLGTCRVPNGMVPTTSLEEDINAEVTRQGKGIWNGLSFCES